MHFLLFFNAYLLCVRACMRVCVCSVLWFYDVSLRLIKPHSNELLALRFELNLAMVSVDQPTIIGHVRRMIIKDSTLATSCLLNFHKYMIHEID
jgi:hypothetical protein